MVWNPSFETFMKRMSMSISITHRCVVYLRHLKNLFSNLCHFENRVGSIFYNFLWTDYMAEAPCGKQFGLYGVKPTLLHSDVQTRYFIPIFMTYDNIYQTVWVLLYVFFMTHPQTMWDFYDPPLLHLSLFRTLQSLLSPFTNE